jgi:uncharacterized protein YbjT (DUF2867 family)
MTILISNANGKAGREVVRELVAGGHDVRVGARDVEKAKARFPGARVVKLDLTKPETFAAAVQGVDAIFSAAPYELLPNGETALIAAAQAAGVARFVKLSAIPHEADPSSPHALAEQALPQSSLAWTVLRPNFFMQNYSTVIAGQVRSGAIYEPAADGATSFVDARDIAAVAAIALTQPGHEAKVYVLTGPVALSRAEVAAELSRAIGKPVAYVPVDDAALRASLAQAPAPLVELASRLFGYVRKGLTAAVTDDVSLVTGRRAGNFAAFAAEHASVWR